MSAGLERQHITGGGEESGIVLTSTLEAPSTLESQLGALAKGFQGFEQEIQQNKLVTFFVFVSFSCSFQHAIARIAY